MGFWSTLKGAFGVKNVDVRPDKPLPPACPPPKLYGDYGRSFAHQDDNCSRNYDDDNTGMIIGAIIGAEDGGVEGAIEGAIIGSAFDD